MSRTRITPFEQSNFAVGQRSDDISESSCLRCVAEPQLSYALPAVSHEKLHKEKAWAPNSAINMTDFGENGFPSRAG